MKIPTVVLAEVPNISSFMQDSKVQTGLGWATIGLAVTFLVAIIVGLYKVVPVAMAFWKRRGADEGAEASTNYLIGWGMLIVVPIVITTIAGFTFGSAIMSAIQTALQSVFK